MLLLTHALAALFDQRTHDGGAPLVRPQDQPPCIQSNRRAGVIGSASRPLSRRSGNAAPVDERSVVARCPRQESGAVSARSAVVAELVAVAPQSGHTCSAAGSRSFGPSLSGPPSSSHASVDRGRRHVQRRRKQRVGRLDGRQRLDDLADAGDTGASAARRKTARRRRATRRAPGRRRRPSAARPPRRPIHRRGRRRRGSVCRRVTSACRPTARSALRHEVVSPVGNRRGRSSSARRRRRR